MKRIASETELASLARTIIDRHATGKTTAAKKRAVSEIDAIEDDIRAGLDPLGLDFLRLRSSETRRKSGAVYTPAAIVEAMIEWAKNDAGDPPSRIVDPGCGSGRFLLAAAQAFPDARLVAVDIDPLAALILKANAAVLGLTGRLTVHIQDFRTLELEKIDGRTLFIGNPPYVRHHQIDEDWKSWFAETAGRLGFKASKLAGLHVHFFLRTREIARPGDFGAYITSSEWLDVNYGALMRNMLANGLGGSALHIIDPAAHPFDDAMTTGVIACFQVGARPDRFSVRAVATLDDLSPMTGGTKLPWKRVVETRQWSTLLKSRTRKPAGAIELGELFRVHRGQVTGCNAVWIAGEHATRLPKRFLIPTVTRARELFDLGGQPLVDDRNLRRVIDLPVQLDGLTADERRRVEAFLAWAKAKGVDKGFVATNRAAWWAVQLREPAPILCTYMARRAPVFVRNTAGARLLNIAHGLYPRRPMTEAQLNGVIRYLNQTANTGGGRTYAGGLTKYEPREVERLFVPEHSA